jgi:hypothetical protein
MFGLKIGDLNQATEIAVDATEVVITDSPLTSTPSPSFTTITFYKNVPVPSQKTSVWGKQAATLPTNPAAIFRLVNPTNFSIVRK